jgi:hypothetical protein
MVMEIIGALIILGHVVGITLILLWIGLGMPVKTADFTSRFRRMFFGHYSRPGK